MAVKSILHEPDLKPVLITGKVTVDFVSGDRIPRWGFERVLILNLGYIPFSDPLLTL